MANKFAKKDASEAKGSKKEKAWTNDPALQDADTGETTPKGKKVKAEAAKKVAAKEGKAAKEAKPAAKGKTPKKEAANESVDKRKIKLLTKENPKREGSAAYERFELYKSNKTVADFIEAGGSTADLRHDEKAGHIELA